MRLFYCILLFAEEHQREEFFSIVFAVKGDFARSILEG